MRRDLLRVSRNTGYSATFEAILSGVLAGEEVNLQGFDTFDQKEPTARRAVSLATGEG